MAWKSLFAFGLWLAVAGAGFAQSGFTVAIPGEAKEFGGIGAVLNKDPATQAIYVASILSGRGAAKVGILPSDAVTEVNGVVTAGKTLTDVVNLIRGPAGSTVEIVVVRDPAAEPLRFLITREKIETPR